MSSAAVNSEIKPDKNKITRTKKISEELEILSKINEIKKELDTALNIFDYVIDNDLVDSCIYDINSLNRQYSYYIRICKEKGFSEKSI